MPKAVTAAKDTATITDKTDAEIVKKASDLPAPTQAAPPVIDIEDPPAEIDPSQPWPERDPWRPHTIAVALPGPENVASTGEAALVQIKSDVTRLHQLVHNIGTFAQTPVAEIEKLAASLLAHMGVIKRKS